MKNIVTILSLSLTIILVSSCGEGESADCSCKEIAQKNDGLYYKTGMIKDGDRVKFGELFSGACEERNADDERVKYMVVKNGYLKKKKEWADVFGELILLDDMEYGFGKKIVSLELDVEEGPIPKNGFFRKIKMNKEKKIGYVSEYKEWEDEEVKHSWSTLKTQNISGEVESKISVSKIDFEDSPLRDFRCTVTKTGDMFGATFKMEELKQMLKCVEEEGLPGFWHSADLSDVDYNDEESSEKSATKENNKSTGNEQNLVEESDISRDMEENEVSEQLYKINDPDGYSNLRKTPGGDIIKKVYEDERFEVIGEEDKHQKVVLEDGTIGFIHNSRVVKG